MYKRRATGTVVLWLHSIVIEADDGNISYFICIQFPVKKLKGRSFMHNKLINVSSVSVNAGLQHLST